MAEIMQISHDSINRFLLREDYTPHDLFELFEEVRAGLTLKGGTVSANDSVLDKPYSQLMAFVGYFWSGKHHGIVKGINLMTLVLHRSARSLLSTSQIPFEPERTRLFRAKIDIIPGVPLSSRDSTIFSDVISAP